jgi:hypothetical protein
MYLPSIRNNPTNPPTLLGFIRRLNWKPVPYPAWRAANRVIASFFWPNQRNTEMFTVQLFFQRAIAWKVLIMSRFVSGGTVDKPTERDDEWLKAQETIEAARRKKEDEARQHGGKSLYEVLQANKGV